MLQHQHPLSVGHLHVPRSNQQEQQRVHHPIVKHKNRQQQQEHERTAGSHSGKASIPTTTTTAGSLFEESIFQRLSPLPDCVAGICSDEYKLFNYLDELHRSVDESLYRQHLVVHQAWDHFMSLHGQHQQSSSSGYRHQILRLHIYNLHFNQRSQQPDVDSYAFEDLTASSPPRWVLRVQGMLLGTPSSFTDAASSAVAPKMTSFFDKIVISRKSSSMASETVLWNWNSQPAYQLLEEPCQAAILRKLAQQETKVTKLLGHPPYRPPPLPSSASSSSSSSSVPGIRDDARAGSSDANPPHSTTTMMTDGLAPPLVSQNVGRTGQQTDDGMASVAQDQQQLLDETDRRHQDDETVRVQDEESRSLQLIDSTAGEGLVRGLVDCDGIEYASEGDVEETIQITLFPSYKVPHFTLSTELEKLVGSNPATLSAIVEAIWLRARKSTDGTMKPLMTSDFTALPCDDILQHLLGISGSTFSFRDLPVLLMPHVTPMQPFTIEHQIKLTGDVLDNEQVFDLTVDTTDIPLPVFSQLSPWVAAGSSEAAKDSSSSSSSSSCFVSAASSGAPSSTPLLMEPSSSEGQDDVESPPIVPSPPTTADSEQFLSGAFTVADFHQLSEIWSALLRSVSKRSYLMEFSLDPNAMMERVLASSHPDIIDYGETLTSPEALWDYEVADKRSDFYRQPWVPSAVESYLTNRKKKFDDVLGKVLTTAAADWRGLTNLQYKDPVMDSIKKQYTGKKQALSPLLVPPSSSATTSMMVGHPYGGMLIQQHGIPTPTARVPMFSQMASHPHQHHHHHHPYSHSHSHHPMMSLGQMSGANLHGYTPPGRYFFAAPSEHVDSPYPVGSVHATGSTAASSHPPPSGFLHGSCYTHPVGVPSGLSTARFLPYTAGASPMFHHQSHLGPSVSMMSMSPSSILPTQPSTEQT